MASPLCGLSATVSERGEQQALSRELPMRQLNARMWGHTTVGERCPKLGGCGRPVGTESRVPIFDHDGAWRPGGLASCDNGLLCDFCGPRVQAESAARFRWHFEDWVAGGGQLLHLRLTVPHTLGDNLVDLLDGLQRGFASLRKDLTWRAAGIVDWVRVLHLRWSPKHGWHPHYHVTGLVKPGVEVNVEGLRAAWRDSLFKVGFTRASKRHGLFGRMFSSGLRALYAWSWADDETEPGEYEPVHTVDLDGPSYQPEHDTLALYQVAEAALNGDQRAWALWREVCLGLKGKPVVRCTKLLNKLWAVHEFELPEQEAEVVDVLPVAVVDSRLWERARRAGCTQMGLAVGRSEGVGGLAQWWASRLGVRVRVDRPDHGPPFLYLSPVPIDSY